MAVTLREIAERAKLSTATVSRVLNDKNDALISPKTRSRVLATAEELGYRGNRAARALATGRTHLVACWLPSIQRSFYANLAHHVCLEAHRRGYEIVIRLRGLTDAPQSAGRWLVDGVLLCDFLDTNEAFQKVVGATPAVGLGAYHADAAPYVGVDLYRGTVAAVQHLLDQGCHRIAYAVPDHALSPDDPRNAAYRETLAGAGIAPRYVPVPGDGTEAAHQAFGAFWDAAGSERPDGVFCRNDNVALGVYYALQKRGVGVPADVALVGCDGLESTDFLQTPLSTIRQPVEAMSRIGWDLLEARMRGESPGEPVLLLPELQIRASSLRSR